MDLRQAAQQALEALEWVWGGEPLTGKELDAITALRAALAESEQEPVAWMVYTDGGTSAYVTDNPNDLVGAYRALPLYTAPPQRKPLSLDEIQHCADEAGLVASKRLRCFARAIERAHGITGGSE